ncbi:hypothetical protein DL546_007633 [Coniochaeta pulveracea]|uniref:CFEM domain-containing protein n=1 Tax=Coniochaeta pulveracea TaxID=177199 RepID=A0A420YEV1_9PEZI|nr:hypothetical protein DL546_007633 [Coniochaeta pulveracea]
MKLSLTVLALATGLSVAQFSGLPTCATDCANQFLAGGIGNCGRDVKCICSDTAFIGQISCCLMAACGGDDQTKAIQFAHDICSGSGVTVPDALDCTSTSSGAAAATTSSASSSVSSSANAASTTSSKGSTQTSASSGTSTTSAASGAVSSVSSAVSSALSSAASSASNNPAPRATAGPMLGAVGGLVAAVALL